MALIFASCGSKMGKTACTTCRAIRNIENFSPLGQAIMGGDRKDYLRHVRKAEVRLPWKSGHSKATMYVGIYKNTGMMRKDVFSEMALKGLKFSPGADL